MADSSQPKRIILDERLCLWDHRSELPIYADAHDDAPSSFLTSSVTGTLAFGVQVEAPSVFQVRVLAAHETTTTPPTNQAINRFFVGVVCRVL